LERRRERIRKGTDVPLSVRWVHPRGHDKKNPRGVIKGTPGGKSPDRCGQLQRPFKGSMTLPAIEGKKTDRGL